MEPSSTRAEMERLLDHAPWVQELARRLVRDPHQAEDLAQDVLVAALESPLAVRSQRAWLAGVLRNRARELLRSRLRRSDRELSTARPIETASTADRVARMSAHKSVVEHVLELPEHYRDTLLRRYFDGQTPQTIAEETGVPVSTVKTRLQRGLEALRTRLDATHGGDGQAWLAALAPLVRAPLTGASATPGPSSSALPATGLPLGVGLTLGVAALSLALFAVVRALRSEPASIESVAAARASASSRTLASEAPDARGTRAVAAQESADSAVAPAQLQRAWRGAAVRPLEGRVVSVEGAPVAGVVVRFEADLGRDGGEAIAVSDAQGRFALAGIESSGLVRAAGAWVTLAAGRAGLGRATDERTVTVVVAPAAVVRGRVVTPAGLSVVGAEVALELSGAARTTLAARVPAGLAGAAPLAFTAQSAADGTFELRDAPRVPGLTLRARRADLGEVVLQLDGDASEDVLIELGSALEAGVPFARGIVIAPDGQPVSGAEIWLSVGAEHRVARSDEAGHFVLTWPATLEAGAREPDAREPGQRGSSAFARALRAPGAEARIVALAPGVGAVVRTLDASELRGDPDSELRLLLEPCARMRGRVVDTAGHPVPGVLVWLADPTPLSWRRAPRGRSWVLGRPTDEAREPEGVPVLEARILGQRDTWHRTRTDGEGRFELGGLVRRTYALESLDRNALARARTTVDVSAEDPHVELVLRPLGLGPRRAGRVFFAGGEPASGVHVSCDLPALSLERGGEVGFRAAFSVPLGTSDEEGRFWIEGLPPDVERLYLDGPDVLATTVLLPLDAGQESTDPLELRVAAAAGIQVELVEPGSADGFEVVDADGRVLPLVLNRGLDERVLERAPLAGGASDTYTTDADARTLRVYAGDVLTREEPLELQRGRTAHVRL